MDERENYKAELDTHFPSPRRIALQLMTITFCVELTVMYILPVFGEMTTFWNNIIDSLVLVILLVPVVFWRVLKPLGQQARRRIKAEEALRKSEDVFYKTFHLNPAVMTISTIDPWGFLDVNKAFEEFTGYKRDDVIGHTAYGLDLWPSVADRELFMNTLSETGHVANVEMTFVRKDGEQVCGSLSAEMIQFENRLCLLTVGVDFTERKRLEKEVLDANGRAKHLEGIQVTAVTLQHEINNPADFRVGKR